MSFLPRFKLEWDAPKKVEDYLPGPPSVPDKLIRFVASATPRIGVDEKHDVLFEYGDRMFNMPRNDMRIQGDLIKPAALSEERFSLWNKCQGKGSFPIALSQSFSRVPRMPVFGQIFRVPRANLEELDSTRDHGVSFNRKLIHVLVPFNRDWVCTYKGVTRTFTEPAMMRVPAWTYVGSTRHWHEQLEWDWSFFKRANGSHFRLASQDRDWSLNKCFYRFLKEDLKNQPMADALRFFRTRSSADHRRMTDIDIEGRFEEDKRNAVVVETHPQSRLS